MGNAEKLTNSIYFEYTSSNTENWKEKKVYGKMKSRKANRVTVNVFCIYKSIFKQNQTFAWKKNGKIYQKVNHFHEIIDCSRNLRNFILKQTKKKGSYPTLFYGPGFKPETFQLGVVPRHRSTKFPLFPYNKFYLQNKIQQTNRKLPKWKPNKPK